MLLDGAMPFEPPLPDEAFGAYIQRARRAAGRTQRDVAAALGIDFTYLSKLENGRGDPPGEETIRGLAAELDLDAELALALAGKVPPELRRIAEQDLEFAMFLRRLPAMTVEQRRRLYGEQRRGRG